MEDKTTWAQAGAQVLNDKLDKFWQGFMKFAIEQHVSGFVIGAVLYGHAELKLPPAAR
jgi:hypothetical protein